jgi:AcrR family transcriptional regulator
MSAREEILDASAQLFSEHGYSATSTRAIAMSVGIKQASLYYHFTNKEQILSELLQGTILPSLHVASTLAERTEPSEVKLWTLAAFDVTMRCSGRWNLGVLTLLPELRGSRFLSFHKQRFKLRAAYTQLVSDGMSRGVFSVSDDQIATDLVLGLVDSVITARQDHGPLNPETHYPIIANGCLRVLAYPPRRTVTVARRGNRLLSLLPHPADVTKY